MNKESYYKDGFTSVFKVKLSNELLAFQTKIYNCTKDYLVSHNSDLHLIKKLKLPKLTRKLREIIIVAVPPGIEPGALI